MTEEEASYLQVGDEVIVRNWEDMANEYEDDGHGTLIVPCRFVSSMMGYCGKTFVIKKFAAAHRIICFVEPAVGSL